MIRAWRFPRGMAAFLVMSLGILTACGTDEKPVMVAPTLAAAVASAAPELEDPPAATVVVPYGGQVLLPARLDHSSSSSPKITWPAVPQGIVHQSGTHKIAGIIRRTNEIVEGNVVVYPEGHRIVVAAVGDSLTDGSGTSDPATRSYPAQLQGMLGPEFSVQGFGVGGATLLREGVRPYTDQGAYGASLASSPDVVVLQLGTNDSALRYRGYDEEFVQQYRDLVDVYRDLPSHPMIVVVLPPISTLESPGEIHGDGVEHIVALIREAMSPEEFADVLIVDNHTVSKAMPESDIPDGVHPNDAGTRVLAVSICRGFAGSACDSSG